eukprot:CAMPEP_0178410956 /NCGR_PEP_ID=MMETSP0689_2-20121128/21249_1 /TAXON_ID=160604 /ORGANISM="Amphidinium massartii, Strain CS-259" /LENGTH=194 /DNA_ID=CAMNT_0020032153 /DNA_START=93 /DNA_END=677 /DNA_ORIENTATION=+
MGYSLSKMWARLADKREAKVVMVGLDGAGKTTILYRIRLGEVVTTIPTIGFNVETVESNNVTCTVWDIGGQEKIRGLWRHYLPSVSAIIFVVDSADRDRIDIVREELENLLREPETGKACLLVFANKQDLPNAMTQEEVTAKLGLQEMRGRDYFVQQAQATKGAGLFEGLDWLTKTLSKQQQSASAYSVWQLLQ